MSPFRALSIERAAALDPWTTCRKSRGWHNPGRLPQCFDVSRCHRDVGRANRSMPAPPAKIRARPIPTVARRRLGGLKVLECPLLRHRWSNSGHPPLRSLDPPGLAALYLLGRSCRKGLRARTIGMMAVAVRAAAATPMVLLEWSAIAPYAIGASPPAPMTPV
jgi:hypothetical protein